MANMTHTTIGCASSHEIESLMDGWMDGWRVREARVMMEAKIDFFVARNDARRADTRSPYKERIGLEEEEEHQHKKNYPGRVVNCR